MKNEFTHFTPEQVLIPQTEKGGQAAAGTQIVVGPDGRIACTGTPEEVQNFLRAKQDEGATIQVETGGVLLPGLTDTHYHPGIYGSLELVDPVNIGTADSLGGIRGIVQERLRGRQFKTGQPLLALNYDSGRIGKTLNQINLDEAGSDQPMFVLDRSFHGGATNTRGAELLKKYLDQHYSGRTFPGHFKDQEFSETYVILALELVESFQTVPEVKEGIENNILRYLSKGVTGMHDLEVMSWSELMAYLLLQKEWAGKHHDLEFPVRRLFLDERVLAKLATDADQLMKSGLLTNDFKGLMGVKFITDGAFGSETAAVSEAYQDSHGYGTMVIRAEEATKAMHNLLRLGMNKIAAHAIGDKAIARAIQFAKEWRTLADQKGEIPEFRFEHFELPLGDTVRQTGELNAWVSIQSNFAVEDAIYHDRLGNRTRLLCPHADLANEGVPIMLGSDGMPDSMLYVVWAAMHHPDPKQRLDLISAITAASAAVGSYEGNLRGSLQVGSKTDIVVATPKILDAFADGKLADEYIAEALKPSGERRDVPVRGQVGKLEQEIAKIFTCGQKVYDATSGH